MEGNEIIAWECDCPYDGNICKHVVATFLAIRDSRSKAGRFLSAKEADSQLGLLSKSMPQIVKDKEVEQILLFAESQHQRDCRLILLLYGGLLPNASYFVPF